MKNSMHITSAQAEDIISLVANNFVDAAECIGVPTLLTLEISFAAKYNSDGTFSNVTIEQRHGDYAVESESEIKPLSFEDLKKSAEEEIDVCLASDLSSLQAVVPLAAADNYNRVAARDYAWQHTAPGYGYHQNDPDLGGYTPSTTCGHTFYDKNGNKTYTESEYCEEYLQSESRQYVFARDEWGYYCVLFPSDVQSLDPTVNSFMENVRQNELDGILDDFISRNALEEYGEKSLGAYEEIESNEEEKPNTTMIPNFSVLVCDQPTWAGICDWFYSNSMHQKTKLTGLFYTR